MDSDFDLWLGVNRPELGANRLWANGRLTFMREPPVLYHKYLHKDVQHLEFSLSATYLYPSDLIYVFFFSAGIKQGDMQKSAVYTEK